MMYIFQYNEDGKAFFKYIFFGDGGVCGGSPLLMSGEEFDYSYSSENNIFTVTVRENDYYVKTVGDGFVFCDANGNTLPSDPFADLIGQ